MNGVSHWLQAQGASHDLVEWALPFGEDFAGLWLACPRADWLLALAVRLHCERSLLVRAALACARCAIDHVPEGETRPAIALAALEAWLIDRGHDCATALTALNAATIEAPDPAAQAAMMAASSAFDAREQPEAAVNAAALTCQAAVLDAGDCAMFESLRFTQRQTARAVRDCIAAHVALGLWAARGSD